MDSRFRLTGDPEFIGLLDRAKVAQDVGNDFDISEWVSPALNHIRSRTAADVITLRSKFTAPSVDTGFWVTVSEQDMECVTQLFHQFSITMPVGIRPLPWPTYIILTIALALFAENIIARSRIKLV